MWLTLTLTQTNSVTGRHWGPKRKLRAGYRLQSAVTKTDITMSCCDTFSSSSVVSCAFSALCVHSTFGHHPHPLGSDYSRHIGGGIPPGNSKFPGNLAAWEIGQLILMRIIEIVATGCQILRLKCTKFDFGWGSVPDPAEEAHSASQTPSCI